MWIDFAGRIASLFGELLHIHHQKAISSFSAVCMIYVDLEDIGEILLIEADIDIWQAEKCQQKYMHTGDNGHALIQQDILIDFKNAYSRIRQWLKTFCLHLYSIFFELWWWHRRKCIATSPNIYPTAAQLSHLSECRQFHFIPPLVFPFSLFCHADSCRYYRDISLGIRFI